MTNRNIIVVGASAGGVTALINLVKSIPANFEGTIFIVLHIAPYSPNYLPDILRRAGHLMVMEPKNGEKIKQAAIYIAPPDHHMLIEHGRVIITKGPKENRFRPSIDALFRSAAYIYKQQVIGIVLSGLLDDGTSGLWIIKRLGGICMIQQPSDAEFPSMPESVLQYVEVDYSVPVSVMGGILQKLTEEKINGKSAVTDKELKLLEVEVAIATEDGAFDKGVLDMGQLTPFTCPDCHGALVQLIEGKIIRFRCHTGHAYTVSSLLADVSKNVEGTLWQAVRGLEEGTMLLQKLADLYAANGSKEDAALFKNKAKIIAERARILHNAVFVQESLSEDIRHKDLNKAHNK